MYPERPSVEEFIKLVDNLADVQDELNKMEYEYSKKVANNVRSAIHRGAKTRELDCVKVLGNSEEEEKVLDGLQQQIFDRKKATRILWGKIEAWKAQKELYRTDSYHTITGKPDKSFFSEEGD
ncbi:MAG: hypothetical protein PHW33_03940 [Candidatus Portnoybacteria bacterium]|jgi:hypothetical protein|nr:hypothetical protein [Candidatus Portnoybacteria bacterium]